MILFFTSILLWIICITLICRLLQFFYKDTIWGIAEKIIWTILLIVSIILLFRPHEDIYGGQDPGSYLNSAVSYARNGSLTYIDSLLSQVNKEQRSLFFYEHSGFRQTKAACLWVKDINTAEVGPWFHPAYPVLMSLIARIKPKFILYVIPLFTIFMGITIAILARIIFSGRWIGIVAFLLYILNTNTIWHGRCPRPGIIAGFLIIGGWTLLLKSSGKQNKNTLVNMLIASIAITTAPFFHITAWFVIIPISIWIFIMYLQKQKLFLIYPPFILISLILIYLQSLYITDCYGIGTTLNKLPISPLLFFILLASAIAIFSALIIYITNKNIPFSHKLNRQKIIHITSGIFAILGAIIFTTTYLGWTTPNKSLFHNIPLFSYIRVTDIKRFVILVSRPMALLGIIGWLILLLKPNNNFSKRLTIALIIFPAAMSIGVIPHLMYYSRYMQPFLIPLFVLCLTALVSIIPQKDKIYNIATPVLLSLIITLNIHNRSHLYSLVEHKGFIKALSPIAEEIKSNTGILLCEYSRIAAPFDHFFGIPTLGIDTKHQADRYKDIANVWLDITKNNPDKTAYFLTPFDSGMTNYLLLKHIHTYNFTSQKLRTSKSLPNKITDYTLKLHLYSTDN